MPCATGPLPSSAALLRACGRRGVRRAEDRLGHYPHPCCRVDFAQRRRAPRYTHAQTGINGARVDPDDSEDPNRESISACALRFCGHRRTHDHAIRGVDEPGHPRFHQPAIDIDLYRGVHMIGFPCRIAVLASAGPPEEHIEVASRPLTFAQTCDVAACPHGSHDGSSTDSVPVRRRRVDVDAFRGGVQRHSHATRPTERVAGRRSGTVRSPVTSRQARYRPFDHDSGCVGVLVFTDTK
ncbi:hypothetical protein DFR75_108128 [Nocardia ignorata]|uniref:Uncharacterized protein n=1 Tax=Nocardia ignorata TaxID=145285 RepID=A0A4R6P3B3_NOCIG|nr:hypothetical protein DFR75_108128 [Nocardia ignorata]